LEEKHEAGKLRKVLNYERNTLKTLKGGYFVNWENTTALIRFQWCNTSLILAKSVGNIGDVSERLCMMTETIWKGSRQPTHDQIIDLF
jgi:hypothetical protein